MTKVGSRFDIMLLREVGVCKCWLFDVCLNSGNHYKEQKINVCKTRTSCYRKLRRISSAPSIMGSRLTHDMPRFPFARIQMQHERLTFQMPTSLLHREAGVLMWMQLLLASPRERYCTAQAKKALVWWSMEVGGTWFDIKNHKMKWEDFTQRPSIFTQCTTQGVKWVNFEVTLHRCWPAKTPDLMSCINLKHHHQLMIHYEGLHSQVIIKPINASQDFVLKDWLIIN